MEFKEFCNVFNKMCEDNDCRDCPIREEKQVTSCRYWVINNPEKAEKIVKDWEKAKETEVKITNRQIFNDFFGVKIEERHIRHLGIYKNQKEVSMKKILISFVMILVSFSMAVFAQNAKLGISLISI